MIMVVDIVTPPLMALFVTRIESSSKSTLTPQLISPSAITFYDQFP